MKADNNPINDKKLPNKPGDEQKKEDAAPQRSAEPKQRPTAEEKSMASIAESMSDYDLQDYLQNGSHWRGRWDIGK